MGLVLTSKTLDASEWGLGLSNVATENLIYFGRYGDAIETPKNLIGGADKTVAGNPVYHGKNAGCTFANNSAFIDDVFPQLDNFTIMAIVKKSGDSTPQYAVSNSRSLGSTSFTLTTNSQLYIPTPGQVDSFTDKSVADTTGFKTLCARISTKNLSPNSVQATLNNLTAGTTVGHTPDTAADSPAGGAFRVGSGYSSANTNPATVLAVMAWNRKLTDEEMLKQYDVLKIYYAKLGVAV